MSDSVYTQVLIEREQHHPTRQKLIEKLESELKRPVISFFTSFSFPVIIDEGDDEIIEDILRGMDLSKGLA
ncbi:unnamed protein product, partial [marine sediment metagenome]